MFLSDRDDSRKDKNMCKMALIVAVKISTDRCKYEFERPERVTRICVEKKLELQLNNWFLHHDNFPVHDALGVCEFLAKKSIAEIGHPIHSTDFSYFQN